MKAFIKILILVVIVVAVLALFKKQGERSESVSDSVPVTKLLDLTPQDIAGVNVVGYNAEYTLSREGGRFRVSGELEIGNVNQEAVAVILETISGLYPIEEFAPDVSDNEINLGGYEILKVSTLGNQQYELRIGDRALTNDTRAVKVIVNGDSDHPRYRISGEDYHKMLPTKKQLLK